MAGLDDVAEQAVAQWLADPRRPKVLHDAKGPLQALAARGWDLRGISTDTALAAYLVRPDQRSYDLADLVLRNLGRELRSEAGAPARECSTSAPTATPEAQDAMVRARAVLDLAAALGEQARGDRRGPAAAEVELPLVHVLARWSAPASPPTSTR